MKIADTVQLADESYYCITDPWRMDWEKGVQVPVLQEQKFKSIKWLYYTNIYIYIYIYM